MKLVRAFPPLILYLSALVAVLAGTCSCRASSPEDARAQAHELRVELELLGDELVAAKGDEDLAARWSRVKHGADVAAALWDAYLAGTASADAFQAAVDQAVLEAQELIGLLVGEDADRAAVLRAGIRLVAMLARQAALPQAREDPKATEQDTPRSEAADERDRD